MQEVTYACICGNGKIDPSGNNCSYQALGIVVTYLLASFLITFLFRISSFTMQSKQLLSCSNIYGHVGDLHWHQLIESGTIQSCGICGQPCLFSFISSFKLFLGYLPPHTICETGCVVCGDPRHNSSDRAVLSFGNSHMHYWCGDRGPPYSSRKSRDTGQFRIHGIAKRRGRFSFCSNDNIEQPSHHYCW